VLNAQRLLQGALGIDNGHGRQLVHEKAHPVWIWNADHAGVSS
jgi:hypothetical protein